MATEKNKGKNLAYVRVSTVEQNEARQLEALKKYDIDNWYIDKASGKDTNRPEYKRLIEYAREGDTVYIHDFSRIARNTRDLLDIVEYFKKEGIKLVSIHENIDSSTPSGKLMLTMIGAIAEFERANLLERQREGIACAVKDGKYKGRKPRQFHDFAEQYERYKRRELNKVQFAAALSVSRPTLDKLIKEYEKTA